MIDGLAALVVLSVLTVGAGGVAGVAGVAGASTSGHGNAKTIKVGSLTIEHVGTVLTTASGLTLYRFTEDPLGMSTCTGGCAEAWPPVTAAKGTHVVGPKGVKGLSVIDVGHGRWQVAFHDVPLYRFAGDSKKGQANGQGAAHTWFAVVKGFAPPKSAGAAAKTATTTTTRASGGGYGY